MIEPGLNKPTLFLRIVSCQKIRPAGKWWSSSPQTKSRDFLSMTSHVFSRLTKCNLLHHPTFSLTDKKAKLKSHMQILSLLIMNENHSKRSNGNWKATKKIIIMERDRKTLNFWLSTRTQLFEIKVRSGCIQIISTS